MPSAIWDAAHRERFRRIVEGAYGPRLVNLLGLTGRSADRLPKVLRSGHDPEAFPLPELLACFGADPALNPEAGGIFGRAAFVESLATKFGDAAPKLRQLHNAGLFREPWIRRVGDLVATNVSSLHAWHHSHADDARAAHLKALGIDSGAGWQGLETLAE